MQGGRLPGEMGGGGEQRGQRQRFRPHPPQRCAEQDDRRRIEDRDPRLRPLPERARARLDPGERVVLDILQCVDRVVAERPGDAAGVEQEHRRRRRGDRAPRDGNAPVEGQAEPCLRPPGDPLHERIGGNQREACQRDPRRQRPQCQQDGQGGERQHHEPDGGGAHGDGPACHRPVAGARDLRVEVTVDDVVIDAPRAAHRRRAEREQRQQPPARREPARCGKSPGARPEQQPRPRRPVEAREPGVGPGGCRQPVDPSRRRALGVGRRAVGGFGLHGVGGLASRRP